MKKLFTILAVALCSTLAMAQSNQYFWAGGQFIMGNPINQIDSITFGQLEQTDSILLYLPRTVKVIHDTVVQYVTIHDTINPCAVPDGAISGKFSVSPTKQVYFSKGNLMFHMRDSIWKFADNQFDYIGKNNKYCGNPSYDGYIDLFGWSTEKTYFGVNTSTSNTTYSGSFVDWSINIGGDWFTPSKDEWEYMRNKRKNADNLCAVAQVNGINGCIFLPDNWTLPDGLNFTAGAYSIYGGEYFAYVNSYTLEQWVKMEKNGAIFLPAAVYRFGTTISPEMQYGGGYWLSTPITGTTSYVYNFRSTGVDTEANASNLYGGNNVRLVQEVK